MEITQSSNGVVVVNMVLLRHRGEIAKCGVMVRAREPEYLTGMT